MKNEQWAEAAYKPTLGKEACVKELVANENERGRMHELAVGEWRGGGSGYI